MNKLLQEIIKADAVIPHQPLAPAAMAISGLIPMSMYEKAMAHVVIGEVTAPSTMISGDSIDIGIVDDTVVAPAASGALAILAAAGTAIQFEQLTALTRVTSLAIETAASADGAITINGTVFNFVNPPVIATDWSTAANLVTAINGAGLGITAGAAGTVVTLTSTVPGAVAITVTETVTAIIAADIVMLTAEAILEVDAEQLAAGATGIRVVVDNLAANTGTIPVHVELVRGGPRYAPVAQTVAVQ